MEHTEHQAVLIEKAGTLVAESIRPRLKEFERENDRIVGELAGVRRYVERLEQQRDALKARVIELEAQGKPTEGK